MSSRFVVSDTHFDHESSWARWKKADGVTPVRPFQSTMEMNEKMRDNWNRVVGKNDIVYHLGDIAMVKTGCEWVRELNGRKRLALGNHDVFGAAYYLDLGFEDVAATWEIKVSGLKAILSHIPLHPAQVRERWNLNIHGHLHDKNVVKYIGDFTPIRDGRFLCASVEQIDYTPALLEDFVDGRFP